MDSSLTEIANKYGTDKGTLGPSLEYGAHNYTDIYDAYLSEYRHDHVILLEIGIGAKGDKWSAHIVHGRNEKGGGSIRMWADYFSKGRIYALDINEAHYLDSDRVHTFVVDQGDLSSISHFLESTSHVEFDFIIDDGSHRPDHQQISLGMLFPRLRSNGIYFIEDLENNGKDDYGERRNQGRHECESVYNTRKVIRSFADTGEFIHPHSIINAQYLKNNISSICFHAPLPRIIPTALINKIMGKRGILVQYKIGTERLCAIRKKLP